MPGIPVIDIPVAFKPMIEARKPPQPPPITAIINGFTNLRLTPNTAGSVIPKSAERQDG